jgi:hypothetical protein
MTMKFIRLFSNQSQIEIQIVLGQYDQTLIDAFSKDLAALAKNMAAPD